MDLRSCLPILKITLMFLVVPRCKRPSKIITNLVFKKNSNYNYNTFLTNVQMHNDVKNTVLVEAWDQGYHSQVKW